jgi:hypothetical protein
VAGGVVGQCADKIVDVLALLLEAEIPFPGDGNHLGNGVVPLFRTAQVAEADLDNNRWVWVAVDVKDAFCNVPIPRLLDLVRKNLIDEDLVRFIKRLLDGAKLPGLRQGGPLSPLFLNLYLDHCLDKMWRKLFPGIPLIRYADDILLLCRSRKEAVGAYNLDGESVEVDEELAPLILALSQLGIETLNSCQENKPGIAWVEFATTADARRS